MKNNQKKAIKWVIGILFFILMIFIGMLVVENLGKNSNVYVYNGPGGEYIFNIDDTGGVVNHVLRVYVNDNEYYYAFRYGPRELENVSVSGDVKQILNSKTLYISQDPNLPIETSSKSSLAVMELNRITGESYYSIYQTPTITAVSRATNRSTELELPEKTCDNLVDGEGVILIERAEKTKVIAESDNCVIIQGINGDEILRSADTLAYKWLGVL